MIKVDKAIAIDNCSNCGEQVLLYASSSVATKELICVWRHSDTGLLDCLYLDGVAQPANEPSLAIN